MKEMVGEFFQMDSREMYKKLDMMTKYKKKEK